MSDLGGMDSDNPDLGLDSSNLWKESSKHSLPHKASATESVFVIHDIVQSFLFEMIGTPLSSPADVD